LKWISKVKLDFVLVFKSQVGFWKIPLTPGVDPASKVKEGDFSNIW